jgi:hypothetical protein
VGENEWGFVLGPLDEVYNSKEQTESWASSWYKRVDDIIEI